MKVNLNGKEYDVEINENEIENVVYNLIDIEKLARLEDRWEELNYSNTRVVRDNMDIIVKSLNLFGYRYTIERHKTDLTTPLEDMDTVLIFGTLKEDKVKELVSMEFDSSSNIKFTYVKGTVKIESVLSKNVFLNECDTIEIFTNKLLTNETIDEKVNSNEIKWN